MAATPDTLQDALRQVIDPELGFNIVDLGPVYHIDGQTDHLKVVMTLTSPACPMGPMIEADVRDVLRHFVPEDSIILQITFDPPWTPERMSDRANQHFGF